MQVKVFVTPRKGILDPQGRTVEHALASLGFAGVSDVKIGRYITLNIDAKTEGEAKAQVSKMCEQLLANSNIEDFEIKSEQDFEFKPESPKSKILEAGQTRKIAFGDD